MSTFYVHPDQVYATITGLVKKHKTAIMRAHESFGPKAVQKLQAWTRRIRPFAPVDTEKFVNGWKYSMIYNGIVIYNDTKYAGAIEFGVAPGRIPTPYRPGQSPRPFRRLVEWTRKRMGEGYIRIRGESKSAYAIATKIQQNLHNRGLKPRKVMTHPARKRELIRSLQEEIDRQLRSIG